MKQRLIPFSLALAFLLALSPFSGANDLPQTNTDNAITKPWSLYMDHVVFLLDYVEATTSLREIFDTQITSHVDLFEKKQRTLDYIAVTQAYLTFLDKYKTSEADNKNDSHFIEEKEKIQALGEPTLATVRDNLMLATQTKIFLDKMIADKNSWGYDKARLVFKNDTIEAQYAQLQKKLAKVDQPVLESSMLTQSDATR